MSYLNLSSCNLVFMFFGGGLLFFKLKAAYIKLWYKIPRGNTSVVLTRSFLVVTVRSIKVRDVKVILVASCTTPCMLRTVPTNTEVFLCSL